MCIPKQESPAPPPSGVPSMQAADNLDLAGGVLRGAAGLGRLKLRTGAATQAPPSKASPAAASLVESLGLSTGSTPTPSSANAVDEGAQGKTPFNRVPNRDLRL